MHSTHPHVLTVPGTGGCGLFFPKPGARQNGEIRTNIVIDDHGETGDDGGSEFDGDAADLLSTALEIQS